ncbi:hypothetical protein [Micromonospora sonchi]|nr:hypothetical protein [Micromonospora sonchi]
MVLDVPSRTSELRFVCELNIEWLVRKRWVDREALIVQGLRGIVERVLSQKEVMEWRTAEQELNGELLGHLPCKIGKLKVLRASATVEPDPASWEAGMQLESARRQQLFESAVRRQAKARVDFLRREVLSDPVAAQLYLVSMKESDLGRGLDKDTIKKLIEDAAWWTPQNRWLLIARIVYDYLSGLSDGRARDLLRAFIVAAEAIGDQEFADRLRSEADEDARESDREGDRMHLQI